MALDYGYDNLIVNRDYRVFLAEYDPDNELPDDDSVDPGDDWGTASTGITWDHMGLTDGGGTLEMSASYTDHFADQLPDPIAKTFDRRNITFATSLINVTAESIRRAYGKGEVDPTAAGASTRGVERLLITDDTSQQYFSLGVEQTKNRDGEAVRVFFPYATPIGSISMAFGNAGQKALVPMQYQALPDATRTPVTIAEVRILTAATGP